MTASNNVVSFPKASVRPAPKQINKQQLAKKATDMKIGFYNEMADDIIDRIVKQISSLELSDMTEDDQASPIHELDVIILRESIVSMMCRLTSIEHPLQPLLKSLIHVKEGTTPDGDMIYTYTLQGDKQARANT